MQGRPTPVHNENSRVALISSYRFTMSCITLLFSVITTDGYELYLWNVRGEQLDKLRLTANQLFIYRTMQNHAHTQCLCISRIS